MFTPKADTPGYYLVQRGRKPRVEYGVTTDVDLLALAKQYFDSHHSTGTSIQVLLSCILPEIKTKSRIAVLVPSELPQPFSEAKYASVEKASDSEYAILLNYEPGVGNAGFAALFAAKANPGYAAAGTSKRRKVKLPHGLLGYFRAVTAGYRAPANLWWKEGRVLYHIQLSCRPVFPKAISKMR